MSVHADKSTPLRSCKQENCIHTAIKEERFFYGEIFSHGGLYTKKLEQAFKGYAPLQKSIFCAKGAISLQLAIRALNLSAKTGIATLFAYAATLSAPLLKGCALRFVDIAPNTRYYV